MTTTHDEHSSGVAPPNLLAPGYRRFFTGRGAVIASSLSSVAVVVALVSLFYITPGSSEVRFFFFHLADMGRAFLGDPAKGLSSVGLAFLTNIWMCLLCEIIVLVLGLTFAWVRVSRSAVLLPVRVLVTVYTDLFRGIPIILVIYIVGFGLPALNIGFLSHQSPAVYGCISLIVTYTAYVAEVYRAGLTSVPNGQILAARSLGLTQQAPMQRIILPQAVRTVVPPLLNDFISLQKDTALVSTLGAIEATHAAQIYASTEFNFSGYTIAALLFLILTVPLTRFTDQLMSRDRNKRLAQQS